MKTAILPKQLQFLFISKKKRLLLKSYFFWDIGDVSYFCLVNFFRFPTSNHLFAVPFEPKFGQNDQLAWKLKILSVSKKKSIL